MIDKHVEIKERQATLEALEPAAPLARLEAAAALLGSLAERAYAGDVEAYRTYQTILFDDIHQRGRPVRDPKRLWLAQELYRVEERFIPDAEDPGTTSPEEFKAFLDGEASRRSRTSHSMSVHLYEQNPANRRLICF